MGRFRTLFQYLPVLAAVLSVAISGCTPGAATLAGLNQSASSNATVIHASLINFGPSSSPFGIVQSYSPAIITVAMGTMIQFHNDDNFNHTASDLGTAGFPVTDPLTTTAETQSGTDISQPGWSTGVLPGNAFSKPLGTSKIGTYFYGCFFHYPHMQGVIIVQ